MQALDVYKISTADDGLPDESNLDMSRWELGTQNFEALAGVGACIDYIASLGTRFGGADYTACRRDCLSAGFAVVGEQENLIKRHFLEGAQSIPGLRILGLDKPEDIHRRTSTFAVHMEGRDPDMLTQNLVTKMGIYCTSGNHCTNFGSPHRFPTSEVSRPFF